jgi:hypothetical protein
VGKVKQLATKLIKRVDWLRVAKRGSGLAFNVLTGLPSPDQIGSVLEGLRSTVGALKDLSKEEIERRLNDAASYLKAPTDDGTNIPEAIHQFRHEFSELLKEAKIEQLVSAN